MSILGWLTGRLVGATASHSTMIDRMAICTRCDEREAEYCLLCGCPVIEKASIASEQCPAGMWGRECRD